MPKYPWFKFYPGDWLSDGKLRKCRAEGLAVWIQALTYMHKEECCSISGEMIEVSMALNLPESQVEEGIRQIEKYDVCDVERDSHGCVTLTSRRLSREEEERRAARERKRKQREREREEKEDVTDSSRTHTREYALTSDSDSYKGSKKKIEKEVSPDYEAVEESWNEFAADVGIPQIRKLNDKRRRSVRQRWDEIWPHIDEIYAEIRGSPFLLGQTGDWTGATFDFVWCRTDAYLKILEGNYRGNKAGRRDQGNGPLSANGRARPGTRGEMSEGLSAWIRGCVEQKRDGELSNFEYAIGCGYSAEDVLGLAGPGDVARYGLPDPGEGDTKRLPSSLDAIGADDGPQDWRRPSEDDRPGAG